MKKINLNVKSNYSLNSKENIKDIINNFNDFDIISITDHNSVKSCYELKDNLHVKLINGLEADATIKEYTFDYLCYGFDYQKVDEWVSKTYMTLDKRQQKIFDKLIDLCKINKIKLDLKTEYCIHKEYAHQAMFRMLPKSFKEENKLNSLDDFYRRSSIDKSFPLYLDMRFIWPSLEELIDIIHTNGGLVFLAHPKKYKFDYLKVLELNKNLVDGIEISNTNETKEDVKELYDYAMSNNLKITYGTNYNGTEYTKKDTSNINSDYENALVSWLNKYLN